MPERVLIYEFITGGGTLDHCDPGPLSGSLLCEGLAMLRAVAADFAGLPTIEIVALRDYRLNQLSIPRVRFNDVRNRHDGQRMLLDLATQSTGTIVIAPEFDGHLLRRVRALEDSGATLLSPGPRLVKITSNKSATATRLEAVGVRVPRGMTLEATVVLPESFDYPAILKPVDGAGSQQVQLVASRAAARSVGPVSQTMRLEEYCQGTPCSVAALGDGDRIWTLPPFYQRLANDGTFAYLGGQRIMDRSHCQRASSLARAALAALPYPVGYVGVDLLLASSPSEDVVIEVNPRLTTSYVGLRRIAEANLATAMLQVARGREPALRFSDRTVAFRADGTVDQ